MAITRHDPFRDLFRLQDSLFRTIGAGYPQQAQEEATQRLSADWIPPVDIFEDADAVTLLVELPGVEAKDVDIQLEGNALTLRGERKLERAESRDGDRLVERNYGTFVRSFTLPTTVAVEHARAESKDGVLRVTLPKKAETKPRQIKVQVESALTSNQPAAKQ